MKKLFVVGGPEVGKSFELQEGGNYIGRSSQGIRINDPTVSRKHLKITARGDKYYLTDLKSRNRTFFNGNYLAPSFELEVKEGAPIAIGMTVICIGHDSLEEMTNLMDSIGITREHGGKSGFHEIHKARTNQKKLELLYKVSDVLEENLPIREVSIKILDHIFHLLKKIDRGIFIFIDPISKEVTDIISKSNPDKIIDEIAISYLRDLLRKVIANRKPLAVSNAETAEDGFADTLKVLKIESLLCVPMIANDEILGFLYLDSLERPYGFLSGDVTLFMDLGRRIAHGIQYSRIVTEASMDSEVKPVLGCLTD